MLTYGFEGAIRIASAAVERLEHARGRVRLALEADAVDLVAVAAGDEPLLEREAPGRRVDPGAEAVVGRRQDRGLDPERPREPGGDGRKRLAGAQRLRANEVEAEIAVAEPEPVLAAEGRDRAERFPRLAGPAPAALLVVEAGEGVEDAVEVGRDRHPEHLEVVADVADDRQIRAARPHRRGRARTARRRRRRRGARPSRLQGAADRGLRPRAGPQADPVADRRACRRRRSDSGSRRRSPARRGCRRGRGSGRRCRRRRAARSAPSRGSASAFVVPSSAST